MTSRSSRGAKADSPPHDALDRLFETVHEGVYLGVIGTSENLTIAANPHLKLMFGYPAEAAPADVQPFEPLRFVDPQARTAFLDRLARDGAMTDYLLRLRREDSAPMWVEVTAHADASVGGHGLRINALIRDVSERKRLEDQTRDLYHQLLQAEKLAALGQTISGVAHELNNPLATILTWAERLRERTLDDTTSRGIDTILSETQRAAKIVRNLLTFARKRNTSRTMVELNQIARETLAFRAYEQQVNNISTIDALAAGMPTVFADPHQVKQVLLNLIINAEQAMLSAHGRGTLVLRSWHDPSRDVVYLEVSDDGPGVPSDLQPRIFDPFFTTKDVGKGTGLGLTVAYAIVQEHGGRIAVRGGAQSGASFVIELPTGVGEVRALPPGPAAAPNDTGAGASVLIVEDEPNLAAAVAEALSEAGFTVQRAADGEEALEILRDQPWDLVICDLKMPRMDGRALYQALGDVAPALRQRLVFVTGDVLGQDAARFLEETGCRWLAKPFRLADLLRVAHEVLAG